MKTNKILAFLAVVMLLLTLVSVNATAGSQEKSYTATVENEYQRSFYSSVVQADVPETTNEKFYSGCFGNQLNGVAKEIYDSMIKAFVTDKATGAYTYSFKNPFVFKAEISGGYIMLNEELKAIEETIHRSSQIAMDAFLADHPEIFWINIIGSSYGVSASWNSETGYIGRIDQITFRPSEIYSGAAADVAKYNSAVDSAVKSIPTGKSRYDTLKAVHDYVCNNAYYKASCNATGHSSVAFFIGNGALVCDGYAKSFKVICDRLNIPCVLVSGYASGSHMWNYVQMDDGKWYLVDTTWDDQVSGIYDTYFIANAGTVGFKYVAIADERTEYADFSGSGYFNFVYPTLSKIAYTPHTHSFTQTEITRATVNSKGRIEKKCTCGKVGSSERIYSPEKFSLSYEQYTYNKKTRRPSVTVKDSNGNTLVKDVDYKLSYEKGRTLPGKYTVKIIFKGKYDGEKKLYFTIKPRVSTGITATQTITTLTLKWNKVTGADGYRVYKYNSSTGDYEYYKSTASTSMKLKNLKSGTNYKFKVRAYVKDYGTIYGSYSPVFETATRAKTPSVAEIYSNTKGKAVVKWSDVCGETGYQLYYSTSKDGDFEKVKSYSADSHAGSKTGLESGRTYYFKIRAYKKTGSGVVYSYFSSVKSVKIK